MTKSKNIKKLDQATQKFMAAEKMITEHPLFSPLMEHVHIRREESATYPKNGYAIVSIDGVIHVNPKCHIEVEEWIYVLAHCLLHLGFEHFKPDAKQHVWNIACDIMIANFLDHFKLGKNPRRKNVLLNDIQFNSEEQWYDYFIENGIDQNFLHFGTGNLGESDMSFSNLRFWNTIPPWRKLFAIGLSLAVTNAIHVASGAQETLAANKLQHSHGARAKNWFISTYPLLGALAANFAIKEDVNLCRQMDISVAAVNVSMKEIYLNPAAGLTENECKFVIAHELLHVGLRHEQRIGGRDPYLWNVACDYVINGWLVEMGLGEMPLIGGLYDPALKGQSAESVYDIISTDLRRLRKLATFRGIGKGDILIETHSPLAGSGIDLDRFYRQCLTQGLAYHHEQGRGLLPKGLEEEIKALSQPPIPWDVELARWFDSFFSPLIKTRTYAKPSRRQAVNPDIPRPSYQPILDSNKNRTFGVILDTSGSMERYILASALGAIVSYSYSRDVSMVRLVFCDAIAYDQGYVTPEQLLAPVKVKGRGGTLLQPGIHLLQQAKDFPSDAPILIITDGDCDQLTIAREHAFLLPAYGRLPFRPKGKLFRIQ